MAPMNKEKNMDLGIEILICLQGKRSSLAFSQRLGYKSNIVHRWRSGHSTFTWRNLLTVCARQKIPVRKKLEDATVLNADPSNLQRLLKFYLPNSNNASLAKAFGVVPSTISKWLKGSSSPPAHAVFEVLKTSKVSWEQIVSAFLPDKIESDYLQELLGIQKSQNILLEHPRLEALLAIALTREVSKDKNGLAKNISDATGFPQSVIQSDIEKLKTAKLLNWSKTKKRYVGSSQDADLSYSRDHVIRALKFWSSYHLHLATDEQYNNKVLYAFATVSVAKEDMEKVRAIHLSFLNQLMELSNPDKSDRVLNTLFMLADANLPALGKAHI